MFISRFLILICLVLFFATVSTPVPAQQTEVHSANSTKPIEQHFLIFPPYWEQVGENSFSGLHYRLAKKIYQHANIDVRFVNTPYQRMQFQVEQGNVAFINYGEVKGVNTEDILHVCVPPTEITLRVYYLKDSLSEIVNIEDFGHQKIIILHGLPLGEYESIKQDSTISFMTPRSIESAMNGLKAGRGDYFITFDNLMTNAKQKYFSSGRYELKNYPLYSLLGYPIVTPKSYKGGKALCERIKASYYQLVKQGVVDSQQKVLVSDIELTKD